MRQLVSPTPAPPSSPPSATAPRTSPRRPQPTLTYEPGLSPQELDAVLERLVTRQRSTVWLLCRYLADMADERRFRQVGWYSDVLHYARERFGLSVKTTRERVRVGRALRELPRVEQAFVRGQLSYSRVRELTRAATAETQSEWLELGCKLGIRELERRVAGAIGGERKTADAVAEVHWTTPQTLELKLELSAEVWAQLSKAMQAARQAAEGSLSDAAALEAVAREALTALSDPDAASIADPRKTVVLYQCRDCRQGELETGAGAVALSAEQAARLGCGAQVFDLATEGKAEACVGGTIPTAVRRAVVARDRGRCRICGRRRYVDVHHLEPQCEGGAHSRENCLCLCTACHAAIHEGRIRLLGNAEKEIRWFDGEGQLLGSDDGPPTAETSAHAEPADSPETKALLQAMGGRGGWTVDDLVEATGLPAGAVAGAMALLVVAKRAHRDPLGRLSPVESARPTVGRDL